MSERSNINSSNSGRDRQIRVLPNVKSKNIVVDIDGVLCEETFDISDYADRKPLSDGISLVRDIHAAGYRVTLFTGRWEEDRAVTEAWLSKYEVPYHVLVLGKPSADIYIDDRGWRWDSDTLPTLREGLGI